MKASARKGKIEGDVGFATLQECARRFVCRDGGAVNDADGQINATLIGDVGKDVIADGKKIPHDACGFGYRTSAIQGLITEVGLKAAPQGAPDENAAKDYLARRKKFPPRTCGSVFKNPSPDTPAGKLLDESGAKSLRVGGAYVWAEHANVIVAGEGSTSSDILALARLMARAVFFRSGIRLEPEIRGLEVWPGGGH